mgnify:CR=1 FL=1
MSTTAASLDALAAARQERPATLAEATEALRRADRDGERLLFLGGGTELSLGFTRAKTLNELLGMADVVCIHADLTRENRGMIDAGAVTAMKPGAYVINTARGPICDTAALLAGLKSGKLAAVAEPAGMPDARTWLPLDFRLSVILYTARPRGARGRACACTRTRSRSPTRRRGRHF